MWKKLRFSPNITNGLNTLKAFCLEVRVGSSMMTVDDQTFTVELQFLLIQCSLTFRTLMHTFEQIRVTVNYNFSRPWIGDSLIVPKLLLFKMHESHQDQKTKTSSSRCFWSQHKKSLRKKLMIRN